MVTQRFIQELRCQGKKDQNLFSSVGMFSKSVDACILLDATSVQTLKAIVLNGN